MQLAMSVAAMAEAASPRSRNMRRSDAADGNTRWRAAVGLFRRATRDAFRDRAARGLRSMNRPAGSARSQARAQLAGDGLKRAPYSQRVQNISLLFAVSAMKVDEDRTHRFSQLVIAAMRILIAIVQRSNRTLRYWMNGRTYRHVLSCG